MRLDASAFFYADGAGEFEDIDRALELAIVFKCSPIGFLDMTKSELDLIYERAIVAFNRVNAEGGE
jgi:hypothetical protein